MKILLVENDPSTTAELFNLLKAQTYEVDIVKDGRQGLQWATTFDYDLILLNLHLPELDGVSVCCQLRAQGFTKPILLLSAHNSIADLVKGLDAGADDYVTQPYNWMELLARMRALHRRGDIELSPTTLEWGGLCLDLDTARVTYHNQAIAQPRLDQGTVQAILLQLSKPTETGLEPYRPLVDRAFPRWKEGV